MSASPATSSAPFLTKMIASCVVCAKVSLSTPDIGGTNNEPGQPDQQGYTTPRQLRPRHCCKGGGGCEAQRSNVSQSRWQDS